MGNRCLKRTSDDDAPKTRIIVPNINVPEDVLKSKHPNANYASNRVRTTKYTLWSFLFLNLFEQFHRFANVYFLFILILNFMPEVSAFAKEIAPIPVLAVLTVTALKDAFEDFSRYRADKRVNQAKCASYSRDAHDYSPTQWSKLHVGDFVRLKCNEVVPADVLILRSSDSAGICHIETSNLDGENNLKQRIVARGFGNGEFDPEKFDYDLEVEAPNKEIYRFHGTLRRGGSSENPIVVQKDNLLLRGCTVRNTDFVEGIVIYAGKETKAMLNNSGARFKRSKLERQINKDVIWCIIILIILCLTGALGSGIWLQSFPRRDSVIYLAFSSSNKSDPAYQAFINFWTFIIIFQAMIPLPLYVSIEFIKLGQIYFIRNDIEMYDEVSDKHLEVRAMNITEDLGQIQYIFSDKTGTLTENKMDFKRCFVAGQDYLHDAMSKASITDSTSPILENETETDVTLDNKSMDSTKETKKRKPKVDPDVKSLSTLEDKLSQPYFLPMMASEKIPSDVKMVQEFFLLLAICNTVVVSINKNDTMPTVGDSDGARRKGRRRQQHSKAHEAINSLLHETHHLVGLMPTPDFKTSPGQLPPLRNSHSCDSMLAHPLPHPPPVPPPDPLLALPAFKLTGACSADDLSDAGTTVSEVPPSPFPTSLLLESYEAESPDEMALVKTACQYGWKLCQRGTEFVSVWLPGDGLQTLKVLQVLPFDSDRKCMSIIIRHPITNQIIIYCKGADSSVFNLLRTTGPGKWKKFDEYFNTDRIKEKLYVTTQDHLNLYARLGLRTLVMARRVIPEDEYNAWYREFVVADASMVDRDEKVMKLYKKIERDLQLLGATGIEDRLQEGVPDTVQSLREAGINVWVLTGDKQETAINIAYSARLISENQTLIILNAARKSECSNLIDRYLRDIAESYPAQVEFRQRRKRPRARPELALCVDGDTLHFALDDEVKERFLMLAEQCRSVICCRATPHQKAEVVQLVKANLQMQTLAIGDGANDVNMIQTADIGIGISGQEGMQAVMASDFSMARFRYLKRLLLVHGHWCYHRFATMALHTFYKDAIFIFLMFWFQLFNGFSGSVMFDQLYQICFNLTMTSLPPIIVGVLDRNVNASTLMANPVLYKNGQMCGSYLPWHFWVNIGDAVWQSLAVFFITYIFYVDTDIGMWYFGTVLIFTTVIVALAMIGIETRSWTGLHWFAVIGSFFVPWVIFAVVYSIICTHCAGMDNPYYVIIRGMQEPIFWLAIVLSTVVSLAPRIAVTAYINTCRPSLTIKARELEEKMGEGARMPLQPKQTIFPLYDSSGSSNPRNNRRVRPVSAPLRTQSMNQAIPGPSQDMRRTRHRRVQSVGEVLRQWPTHDVSDIPDTAVISTTSRTSSIAPNGMWPQQTNESNL